MTRSWTIGDRQRAKQQNNQMSNKIQPGSKKLSSGAEVFWNKEFKQRPIQGLKEWTEALRSGKYKQGRGELRKTSPEGDKFCCLGVKMDLEGGDISCAIRGISVKEKRSGDIVHYYSWYFGYCGLMEQGRLAVDIVIKPKFNPQSLTQFTGTCLSDVNDSNGLNGRQEFNFTEIAEIIELMFCEKEQP